MEMLSLLTNSEQENESSDAEFAAETILLGRDMLGTSIYERLFDLLQIEPMEEEDEDDDRRDEIEMLRPLALRVMRNALVVLARGTDIREVVEDRTLPEWLVDGLLPIFLSELQRVEKDPHSACLAVECIMALLELSDRAKSRAVEENALPIIERARDFGVRYHASLAQASSSAATALQSFMNCKTEKD